jgi:O-acetylhomoserine (thiol)-lyase
MILFESLSNPNLQVADFKTIVDIANKHNIITVVDNTVATPILCNPIKLGCDIVVHSTSKYTTGQGLALGGIIVDSATSGEKIKGNDRYSHFNEPDDSYHGLVYSDLPFPPFIMRILLSVLRDLGAAPSPFNSWLMIQGLETLTLRMKEHSASALKVAQYLESNEKVKKVNYPGLESDSNYTRAQQYLIGGNSGLLSFEVDSLETAKTIVDNIEIFSCVVNIGDSKSIITHPASTTHQQLSAQELEQSGIGAGLIRLSIGLENADDLIEALKKVL